MYRGASVNIADAQCSATRPLPPSTNSTRACSCAGRQRLVVGVDHQHVVLRQHLGSQRLVRRGHVRQLDALARQRRGQDGHQLHRRVMRARCGRGRGPSAPGRRPGRATHDGRSSPECRMPRCRMPRCRRRASRLPAVEWRRPQGDGGEYGEQRAEHRRRRPAPDERVVAWSRLSWARQRRGADDVRVQPSDSRALPTPDSRLPTPAERQRPEPPRLLLDADFGGEAFDARRAEEAVDAGGVREHVRDVRPARRSGRRGR